MTELYSTNQFDIRHAAMEQAIRIAPPNTPTRDVVRAAKEIEEYYLRPYPTKENNR